MEFKLIFKFNSLIFYMYIFINMSLFLKNIFLGNQNLPNLFLCWFKSLNQDISFSFKAQKYWLLKKKQFSFNSNVFWYTKRLNLFYLYSKLYHNFNLKITIISEYLSFEFLLKMLTFWRYNLNDSYPSLQALWIQTY